jgi:hypothetical protein
MPAYQVSHWSREHVVYAGGARAEAEGMDNLTDERSVALRNTEIELS